MTNNCGVYKITNTANGKFYIGSSCNIEHRLYVHRWMLVNNTHENAHLQNAWNKYGADSFTFETILLCDEYMTLYCEQEILEQWKPAYNIATCAEASARGLTRTEEARTLISAVLKGNTNSLGHKHTLESRALMSAAAMGNTHSLGHTHTPEARALISLAAKRDWAARRIATGGTL